MPVLGWDYNKFEREGSRSHMIENEAITKQKQGQ